VVNLVQAQINDATMQGTDRSWASQPGAIRTFNGGALERIYRLYSAGAMTARTASELDTDMPPTDWAQSPAMWVDLNAPVNAATAGGAARKIFPILDPRNPSDPATVVNLPGFALKDAPGAVTSASDPLYQPAPMPVRWLYVLRDGQLVAPSGGKTATIAGASSNNPIVGRVAFWTDDETCKINVNTASDGTFWDSPRYTRNAFPEEKGYAFQQPVMYEFQRYPGHPATTSMRFVFNALGLNQVPSSSTSQGTTTPFFDLLSRYNDDYGSKSGTVSTVAMLNTPTRKSSRLYSSVGEMRFEHLDRDPTELTRERLDVGRFFLTAKSRAPEVNLFGKPRVSIWPVFDTNAPNTDTRLTPTDRLLAFCSTVNGKQYYFSRKNPYSRTTDINLPRNASLLSYLDGLTSTSIPGVGNSFTAKYTQSETRQILTEIFDFVRSTNLADQRIAPALAYARTPLHHQVFPAYHAGWDTQGFGRFPVISEITLLFVGAGRGKLSPGEPAATSQAIPVDSRQKPVYDSSYNPPSGVPGAGAFEGDLPPPGKTAVQAFLIFNFFNPTAGNRGINPAFSIKVEGMDSFKINGNSLNMSSNATFKRDGGHMYGLHQNNASPNLDYRTVFMDGYAIYNITGAKKFPFYSQIIDVDKFSPQTMNFTSGAPLKISLIAESPSGGELVQKYEVQFPTSQTLPIPDVVPHTNPDPTTIGKPWLLFSDLAKDYRPGAPASFAERNLQNYLGDSTGFQRLIVNPDFDTILSMVPDGKWADYRLLAARPCNPAGVADAPVPVEAFKPHPNAGNRAAYGFRVTAGQNYLPNATGGNLTNGIALETQLNSVDAQVKWRPLVSARLTGGAFIGATNVPGDWNTPLLENQACPTINKADEGTTAYGDQNAYLEANQNGSLFSPNRMMPSPVVFGSLPTGAKRSLGWQTLNFRPAVAGHPGLDSPRDHYLLDLFWMPVAEPYAISEPFSTDGKINLNYQIVPFSYITRNTALRAVLSSEKVAMVGTGSTKSRYDLNLSDENGTLRQFKEKFANGEIFRSASEICDVFLVPEGETWAADGDALTAYTGPKFAWVGDNLRERPYASIYPRVTTKSNTYTVYYTVQSLKIPPIHDQGQWEEGKGVVLGSLRGATTLERYLDLADTKIPDFATNAGGSLESYYRWRIVANNQFAP
jgi:uncharacterized protein (TIGR02600 family)